ncbi:MAG: uroporphyrinogen-III synthase [Saprospiraceae bacterium]
MAKSVFISRELSADSVFLQKISATGATVHGESLLKFRIIPFLTLPTVDWIFFYSKTAVRFFFQQIEKSDYPNCHYAAIGERTAATLKKYVDQIDFIGNGNPPITASNFLAFAKGQRVLFPRAQRSRKSVQTLLEKKIEVVDLVIYDNQMRTDIELGDFDILVFTSPLNARAYFKNKSLRANQSVIAIGVTTANTLHKIGLTHIYIATTPSESGLAESVLKLIATKKG